MANILVVEDDRHISELVKRNLTLVGHTCTCCYDGLSGLETLQGQSFDLILLDVMMSEMDGLETLRHIRKIYRTPVVLMTANKTLDASVDFAELGCDDYITKPFLPILLKEVVYNMTERTRIGK